jgi:RNA polymerase sigma-70 factor (ECF subfamily)
LRVRRVALGAVESLPLSRNAQLIEDVHNGAPGAARALYERFSGDINGIVWRVLGADSEHDDVVQLVFTNVFRNLSQIQDPDRLRSWIAGVAVRTSRNEIRRRKRHRFLSFGNDGIEKAAEIEAYDSRELIRRVHRILDRLPADLQVVFVLRFVEERPLLEVAELAGCSVATVKRRIKKARERFEVHARKDPDLAGRIPGGADA